VPERRRFWKRLAKLRRAFRIRRKRPVADIDAPVVESSREPS
jgi:hypothetical protein